MKLTNEHREAIAIWRFQMKAIGCNNDHVSDEDVAEMARTLRRELSNRASQLKIAAAKADTAFKKIGEALQFATRN